MGIDYVTDSIRFAEEVGSTLFSGPVYSAVGKARMIPDEERKQQWDWCVANLRKLGKVASDAGVTMGIEPLNRFETDMITLAEHALRLIDDVGHPAYKVHIDTFHANIEEKSIPDAIRLVGEGRLGHFHACENDRGTPGTGHQDWNGIRDALKEINMTARWSSNPSPPAQSKSPKPPQSGGRWRRRRTNWHRGERASSATCSADIGKVA